MRDEERCRPVIYFGEWSVAEARAYCEAYAASVPIRVRWLNEELAARGEDPDLLTAGPNGLPALWEWACHVVDSDAPLSLRLVTSQPADDLQPGPAPPWQRHDQPVPIMSNGLLWLVELLAAHLATQVMQAAPQAHWDIYRVAQRLRDIDQNRTKLFGLRPAGVDPARMVYSSMLGRVIHHQQWNHIKDLTTLYHRCLDPDI